MDLAAQVVPLLSFEMVLNDILAAEWWYWSWLAAERLMGVTAVGNGKVAFEDREGCLVICLQI